MAHKILVGSADFMNQLAEDASRATHRFYVQAMTFEGDAAGEALIDILLASKAKDRRISVDSYSKVVVNDQFVFVPGALFSKDFRAEVARGKALLEKAQLAGVKVCYTNPVGVFMYKYPFRNHKKSIVCDDVAYLGGVNFSDHNFAWHDMMVRLEDKITASAVSADFLANFAGFRTEGSVVTPIGKLYFLPGILNSVKVGKAPARDVAEYGMNRRELVAGVEHSSGSGDFSGRKSEKGYAKKVDVSSAMASSDDADFVGNTAERNKSKNETNTQTAPSSAYKDLFDEFRAAREEILIFSPYVSSPLLDVLKNNVAQSVKVNIVTPEANNKSLFKKNLLHESAQGYFNLYFYPNGMSHLKAALIDRKKLIIGSSNYDFASFYFEDEIMMSVSDASIIKSFVEQVVDPTMESVRAVEGTFAFRSSAFLLKTINTGLANIARIKGISIDKSIS
jgi:phosphatidylserine/phosphatidylglycerophosphate/cardiolipin synthase-like enzyme